MRWRDAEKQVATADVYRMNFREGGRGREEAG